MTGTRRRRVSHCCRGSNRRREAVAAEEVIRHLPGFVSADIHAGLDGSKVVNYAQQGSEEAFTAMFADPTAGGWPRKLAEIGTPAPGRRFPAERNDSE
jgi:hypothetical protein